MNRQEALNWCIDNVQEWAVSSDFNGWFWDESYDSMVFTDGKEVVTKQDWLDAEAEKKKNIHDIWKGAPEGATHYSPEDSESYQTWWKVKGGEIYYICNEGDVYNWVKSDLDKSVQLIPRQTEQPYTPRVDVKCLGNIRNPDTKKYSYVEAIPLRDLGAEWVVQVGDGGRPSYCDEFLPSEQERKTETAYDLVKDAVDLYAACEILIEAGYKK